MNTKKIAFNGLICALYVLLTTLNPISYGMIQLRFSEMLAILPFYNRKYITPVCLGVFIANMFSPMGFIDVVCGLLVALISYSISKYIKNVYINCIIYALTCGLVIGGELFLMMKMPFIMSFVSISVSQIFVTFLGTIVIKVCSSKFDIIN